MKNIVSALFIALLVIGGTSVKAQNNNSQEGTVFGDYMPGFYFDKDGNKVEGFIKYTIVSSKGTEKYKSFKFKKSEGDKSIKLEPEDADGFGINGSDRVYHTVYSSEKNKKKNKKGRFARVLYGGESVNENATMYYPLDDPITTMISDSKTYNSTFMVRYKNVTESSKTSLLFSKHKKTFKKLFKDSKVFNEGLEKDENYLDVSNLAKIIKDVNEEK